MGETNLDSLALSGNLTVSGNTTLSGTQSFADNITLATDKKLQLRDSGLYIHSSADGQLDLVSDSKMVVTAPDIDFSGKTNRLKMEWMDDFLEPANALASTVFSKAHWTGGGTSGNQAIVSSENGVMELDTTTTGSRSSSLTFSGQHFNTNNAPVLEARLKTDALTNRKIEFGWYVDANDCLMFRFDTAVDAGNIYLISENDNGGEVATDTGVDLTADTYITARIEINEDETFRAFIDGTQVASGHTGTIRQMATFKPYFYVDNKSSAQSNKLKIDYVKIWQNRS